MNSPLALLQPVADIRRRRVSMRVFKWVPLAAVVLLGCPDKGAVDAGVVDAGPKEVAEKEPNDRPEQALVLSESSIVTAALTSDPAKQDEDWYALQANGAKIVDVAVSGIPGGDVALEVVDADRNRLALVNSE